MKRKLIIAFLALSSILSQAQISFTANQNTFCFPSASLILTNNSSSGVNFYWYMGDGGFYQTTSTTQNVSHSYSQPGQYYVYVDAYDVSWNYLGTFNQMVNVEGLQNPLTVNDNTVCPGDLVYASIWNGINFNNISWDWGDGTVFNNTQWTHNEHRYLNVGTYTVIVSANFPTCGLSTATANISVGTSYPVATNNNLYFGTNEDSICPGDPVSFYVPNDYETFYIQYDDGSLPGNEYSHIYNTTGKYYPTLTLVNGCGNSLQQFDTIHIVNNLPLNINTNQNIVWDTFCINSPVEFYTPYWGYNSVWDFGNGNTASGGSVTHTYPNVGNYPVAVTLTNGCGSSATIFDTVTISNNKPVTGLRIEGSANGSICPSDGFFVEADVDGGRDLHEFLWDFGDGNTATLPNVSHAYASAGSYTVTLTATNFCGMSDNITQVVTVGTNVTPDPNDYFAGILGDGKACPGDSVIFIFGPGSPTADILWDFGDGNTSNSTSILSVFGINYNYVKHVYPALGNYATSVTYTNSCGNSFNIPFPLNIENNLPPQDPGFFEDPNTYNCQGQPIAFFGYGGSTMEWDFGDGTGTLVTYSELSPVYHTYENPGTYEVEVRFTNGCGATAVQTETVIVPLSGFEITTNTISSNCSQENGKAIAIVEGGRAPFTYQWSNGDNTFIADSISAGIYLVDVTDKNGCRNYAIATVSDLEAPSLLSNAVLDVTCYGNNNGAIDLSVIGSSAPYTYLWSNGRTTEDVNNLEAGPHEIIVTDANGCIATKSVYVNQPDEVNLAMFSQNADCGVSNGAAMVTVSGTTSPYNYIWSNGMGTNQITGLSAGIYSVSVVDVNGCLYEDVVAVSEGSISIVTDSITGTGCVGDLANIYVNVIPVSGTYTYNWSNSNASQDNLNLSTGVYSLELTDINNGCVGYAQYEIQDLPTVNNEICLVSVDSISNTNRVIWEKDLTAANISHYKIYRESSQAGVYYHVGDVSYDSSSVFKDPVANPQIRAWRYKISVVDDCGNESEASAIHKSIHLTVNEGIGNTYNLIWDHYDGLNYATYDVYRKTSSSGWQLVTSLPSNLNSYTDATPPAGTEYYRVEALMNVNCDPTRSGVNTSRSNVRNTPSAAPFGLNVEEGDLNAMILYPNPTTGLFSIEINSNESNTIEVYNSIGEIIGQEKTNAKFNFDLTNFSRGIYFVRVDNGRNQKIIKVIKN